MHRLGLVTLLMVLIIHPLSYLSHAEPNLRQWELETREKAKNIIKKLLSSDDSWLELILKLMQHNTTYTHIVVLSSEEDIPAKIDQNTLVLQKKNEDIIVSWSAIQHEFYGFCYPIRIINYAAIVNVTTVRSKIVPEDIRNDVLHLMSSRQSIVTVNNNGNNSRVIPGIAQNSSVDKAIIQKITQKLCCNYEPYLKEMATRALLYFSRKEISNAGGLPILLKILLDENTPDNYRYINGSVTIGKQNECVRGDNTIRLDVSEDKETLFAYWNDHGSLKSSSRNINEVDNEIRAFMLSGSSKSSSNSSLISKTICIFGCFQNYLAEDVLDVLHKLYGESMGVDLSSFIHAGGISALMNYAQRINTPQRLKKCAYSILSHNSEDSQVMDIMIKDNYSSKLSDDRKCETHEDVLRSKIERVVSVRQLEKGIKKQILPVTKNNHIDKTDFSDNTKSPKVEPMNRNTALLNSSSFFSSSSGQNANKVVDKKTLRVSLKINNDKYRNYNGDTINGEPDGFGSVGTFGTNYGQWSCGKKHGVFITTNSSNIDRYAFSFLFYEHDKEVECLYFNKSSDDNYDYWYQVSQEIKLLSDDPVESRKYYDKTRLYLSNVLMEQRTAYLAREEEERRQKEQEELERQRQNEERAKERERLEKRVDMYLKEEEEKQKSGYYTSEDPPHTPWLDNAIKDLEEFDNPSSTCRIM